MSSPDVLGSYWTLAGPADPTGREWSPWPVEERVRTAAEVGFTGMGFWHADLERILRDRSPADLRALLSEHGIEHLELEFVDGWFLPPDHPRRAGADDRRDFLLDAAETLDADHVKVGNIWGIECPVERLAGAFEALCAAAERYDTRVALELTSGEPNLRTLDDAFEVVRGTTGANGGLLLDLWHLERLGIDAGAVKGLPPASVVAVELNDGLADPSMDRTEETLHHRQLPGEGAYDVRSFVEAVRSIGFDGPWGVEVLSAELRALPMAELYERAYGATVSALS